MQPMQKTTRLISNVRYTNMKIAINLKISEIVEILNDDVGHYRDCQQEDTNQN